MTELERVAGSVIMCGFDGPSVPGEVRSWIADDSVAGLILFQRNIESVEAAAELIASCTADGTGETPLLVGVDQEGGRVARLGDPIIALPPMRSLGNASDPALTSLSGTVLGRQLRAVGFNLDFAPVLDVDTNPDNPVIGDRAFGATPDVVTEHALAFASGLARGGVLSCGKHFPGHGDTDVDSHHDLPRLRHGRDRLDAVELQPFRAAVGALPSIMTAHVVFDELDHVPATLSSAVIRGLLRHEIGYRGAVFTDDLEMSAVSAQMPVHESGLLAIEAGCDVLLVCSDVDGAAHLRETLTHEAEASERFRSRLEEAYGRAHELRRAASRLPPAVSLQNALEGPEVAVVQERLQLLD